MSCSNTEVTWKRWRHSWEGNIPLNPVLSSSITSSLFFFLLFILFHCHSYIFYSIKDDRASLLVRNALGEDVEIVQQEKKIH